MIRGVHHTALFVGDLDRSLAFYTGTLGCELISRSDDWGGPFLGEVCGAAGKELRINVALLRVPGDTTIFELIEAVAPAGFQSDSNDRGWGIARLGFEVDEIEATVAALGAQGVEFLSGIVTVAAGEGQHYSDGKAIKFLDPDGIVLELQQPPQPGRVT